MEDFSRNPEKWSIKKKRGGEKYQILARDTERRKGWRSVWIYISKNRLTISLIVDATKLNEYINKIRRRRYLKKVPCIMCLFLLIFFNLVGVKKEYFDVALTSIFLKLNENFMRNLLEIENLGLIREVNSCSYFWSTRKRKWKKMLLGWILFKFYRILLNYNKQNYVVVVIVRCV